jgi:hypothetical protein
MSAYSSGKHTAVTADPEPWLGADGSRRARYSRFAPQYLPRPEYARPLTNPANSWLGEFRNDWETNRWLGDGQGQIRVWIGGMRDLTDDKSVHARRVLERFARIFGGVS